MLSIQDISQQSILMPWHVDIWQRLVSRFPDLAHGLLFYGKQGAGKQYFASHFAAWLLCTQKNKRADGLGACGECQSCRWIAAGTHPQLKIIAPDFDEKKQSYSAIKIDQIRELADFVQQTVDGWRVVLIYPAEQLNIAAANALLKTLEEPGDRVVLILVSDAMLKLPATIRSRVQQIALDRISPQQAQHYLLHQNFITPALSTNDDEHAKIKPIKSADSLANNTSNIQIALALAADMPLKAADILASEWFKQRLDFVQAWSELVQYKRAPIKFSTQWLKNLDFRDVLMLMRYLIQDIVALKLQQQVKQTDLPLKDLALHYNVQELFDLYAQINEIQRMQAQNIQSQLMFDELTIRLMNIKIS